MQQICDDLASNRPFLLSFSVKTRIQAGSTPAVTKKADRDEKKELGQATVRKGAGMFEGIVTIAKSKEGITGLYRGFGASMVNTFSTRKCNEKTGVM